MTNNSDGLTPTLRPQLGVGWNRALPNSFGFDNCLHLPDSPYSLLRTAKGGSIPKRGTFEFWAKDPNLRFGVKFFDASANKSFGINVFPNNGGATQIGNIDWFLAANSTLINRFDAMGLTHHVITYDFENTPKFIKHYKNGIDTYVGAEYNLTIDQSVFTEISLLMTDFGCVNYKIDELRIYNHPLSLSEVVLNYNNGMGNNPCVTEHLFLWYKFQKFENLDFSEFEDATDVRLGIRDYSNHRNHSFPISIETDPENPNYPIKPF